MSFAFVSISSSQFVSFVRTFVCPVTWFAAVVTCSWFGGSAAKVLKLLDQCIELGLREILTQFIAPLELSGIGTKVLGRLSGVTMNSCGCPVIVVDKGTILCFSSSANILVGKGMEFHVPVLVIRWEPANVQECFVQLGS